MTEEVPPVALDCHSLACLLARSGDPSGMPRNLSEGSEVSAKAQALDCHISEELSQGEREREREKEREREGERKRGREKERERERELGC